MQPSSTDAAYFKAAQDWHFDRYANARVQANRWFVATCFTSILLGLSIIALSILMPLKTLVPLVIHQNTTTGDVWVTRPSTKYVPENDAEVQSDIVRYITARESYNSSDINQRFQLVKLLSNQAIAKIYADEQSNSNDTSPINFLGEKGSRTVRIEDIVFIDKANVKEIRNFKQKSQNLAKVDFVTTTRLSNGATQTDYFVATIGWTYQGLPNNQQDAWDNWNGFLVTTYRVDPKNVSHPLNEKITPQGKIS